jgi:hypothetical protein
MPKVEYMELQPAEVVRKVTEAQQDRVKEEREQFSKKRRTEEIDEIARAIKEASERGDRYIYLKYYFLTIGEYKSPQIIKDLTELGYTITNSREGMESIYLIEW